MSKQAHHDIGERKSHHIEVCLSEDSQFDRLTTGFDHLYFEHEALPEISLGDVDLSCEFLGKRLDAPILVSSMTGGPLQGEHINRNLALGVQAAGLGMGVGSQRIAIERPETEKSFEVRKYAPDILLLANLGAVQLNYGYGAAQAKAAVDMIGADGLFFHLNPLQEAVQEEGDIDFSNLLARLGALAKELEFPVLVKECGCGISPRTLRALVDRGIAAVDVSGAGGTSWSKVEGLRAQTQAHRTLGETFANWGIPTAVAIAEGRRAVPEATIIGSGGVRSGLDIAKALALGADVVSLAKPVLAAALDSGEAVHQVLEHLKKELRIAFFCVGAKNLEEFRDKAELRNLSAG